MNITINMNDTVGVKLTEHGISIMRNEHESLNTEMKGTLGPFVEPVGDEEGWTYFQLWALMHIFGRHTYNGCIPPYGMDMRIGRA